MSELELKITDRAAQRIKELINKDESLGKKFRISVLGGGCSGFQYKYDFDNDVKEDDKVFNHDGTEVIVDDLSLSLMPNSTLDFVEDLGGSAFEIKNPNATAKCGCGNSFAI